MIQLIRSGDVIPKVEKVIKPAERQNFQMKILSMSGILVEKTLLTNFGDNEIKS